MKNFCGRSDYYVLILLAAQNMSRKLITFFCMMPLKMTSWLYHIMMGQRLDRSLLIDLHTTVFNHSYFFKHLGFPKLKKKNPIHYLESQQCSSVSHGQRNSVISCLSNFRFPKAGTGTYRTLLSKPLKHTKFTQTQP